MHCIFNRLLHTVFLRLFAITILATGCSAEPAGTEHKTGLPVAGLHTIIDDFLDHKSEAAEAHFWQAVEKNGTPLVTPTKINETGNKTVQMTFLWRGDQDTHSIELLGSKRTADSRSQGRRWR